MPTYAVIIAAAGKSSRFDDKNYKKPFAPLAGKSVWLHAADHFVKRDDVKQIIVVIASEDREMFQMKYGANIAILGIELVEGGDERADSIQNALAKVNPDIDFVAVHDAARPCIADTWIDEVFQSAAKHDAAILATQITGTVKRASNSNTIEETVSRDRLWQAQTPQVFKRDLLIDAYTKRGNLSPTDEAQAVEALGKPVKIVPCSPMNLKITNRGDLKMAEQLLKALPKPKLENRGNPFAGDDIWR